MGRQGARFARRRSRFHPLTPHLAQKQLSRGFNASLRLPRWTIVIAQVAGARARLWRVGTADCTPPMMDKPLDKGV
jgi:hypothetical protein